MNWTQEILCKIYGHKWINYVTYVPVRAGPLMSTKCKRCGAFTTFPQNVEPIPDPTKGFTKGELQSASLRIMNRPTKSTPGWLRGTIEECDRCDESIKQRRVEYANFTPKRLRDSIFDWLDYFQKENNENRKEIKAIKETGFKDKDDEKLKRKMDAEEARVKELMGKLSAAGINRRKL